MPLLLVINTSLKKLQLWIQLTSSWLWPVKHLLVYLEIWVKALTIQRRKQKEANWKARLLGKLYKLIPSVCYWKNVKWTSAWWVLVTHAYSVILLRIPGRSAQWQLTIVYVELLWKNYREFLSEFHRILNGAWKHCPVFRVYDSYDYSRSLSKHSIFSNGSAFVSSCEERRTSILVGN